MKDPHRYDDMLSMPHHQSKAHTSMSRSNRAAQFSPFAALTGYEDSIGETARLTDKKKELDENAKNLLDMKLQMIMEDLNGRTISDQQINPGNLPEFTFTYFVPDFLKEGGSYKNISGIVKKLNTTLREITVLSFTSGNASETVLGIDRIVDIRGELFKGLEEPVL